MTTGTGGSSEDRWVYPADGETPKQIDEELFDPEAAATLQQTRSVTHRQPPAGEQGISSDTPGTDPSTRQGDEPETPTAP